MRRVPKYRHPLPGNGHGLLGVTWYENEPQWLQIRMTATDPDNLYDSYSEWAANAEEQLRELRTAGVRPVKVTMIGEDFLAWCRERRRDNCGPSRSEYVAWTLQRRGAAGAN